MAHKTPNYSQDRSQRERAKQAKVQKRSDLRTEKSDRRKVARGEVEPRAEADVILASRS
jgi:hypothetical protein